MTENELEFKRTRKILILRKLLCCRKPSNTEKLMRKRKKKIDAKVRFTESNQVHPIHYSDDSWISSSSQTMKEFDNAVEAYVQEIITQAIRILESGIEDTEMN